MKYQKALGDPATKSGDEISINSIIKNPKLEKKFEIDFKF